MEISLCSSKSAVATAQTTPFSHGKGCCLARILDLCMRHEEFKFAASPFGECILSERRSPWGHHVCLGQQEEEIRL
jgi:hypothetical protein